MKRAKIKNSIKSISNIDEFYLELIGVMPKISLKNEYYFILLFEDGINYKTDTLNNYNPNDIKDNTFNFNLDEYYYKKCYTLGEIGKEYVIDNYNIQDLLYYMLDDTELFYHDKFNNIYYTYEHLNIIKTKTYYSSRLFTRFFKLRDCIDEVNIVVDKKTRQYNKKSE